MSSAKYRTSPSTRPEEQTTPQASSFSFRRLWGSPKQTGSVPSSKKARYAGEGSAATTPQGTPSVAPSLIASVSTKQAATNAGTLHKHHRPSSSESSEEMYASVRRNLTPDFETTAQPKSKLFGLFSPMFSLFSRNHRDASEPADATQTQEAPQMVGQEGQQPQQEATTSPAANVSPTAAQPARRNSNVVAMEDEDSSDDEEQIDWDDESNPYSFIRRLPYLPRVAPSMSCAIAPKDASAHKPTLVLDLDETLVHCTTEPAAGVDVVFPVVWNGVEYRVYARRRPGLEAFMEAVTQMYEVVVFTASQQVYADKLLDILDPQNRWFKHRVFRDACVCVEGNYLKDLTILGRDLARTIIIDNSPQAFGFQYNNGIPILSWFDTQDDTELAKLLPLLRTLSAVPDVRPVLRSHFKLYKRIERRTC